MNKVTLGLILAIASLILLHNNQPLLGLPVFILGILLMNKGRKR